jgi:hypothetical protein
MKIRPDAELAWARPIARPEILRPEPKTKPPVTSAAQSAAQARPEAQLAQSAAPAQPTRIVPRGSFVNIRV